MKHSIAKNLEWGRKARKEEDDLRGLNNSDRQAAIDEQLADFMTPADHPYDDDYRRYENMYEAERLGYV